jgi:serine/threonine protein phosphatase PrpC
VDALAGISTFGSAFAFRRAVRAALLAVNAQLCRKAAEEYMDTIGSTVVTLLAHEGHYACIWAGDSRAYLQRGGRLRRITRDHSLVQELVEAGRLDPDDASRHPQANVVTRAVGAGESLDLEGVYGRIEAGDRYLLCSDGLGVLADAEIEARVGLPMLGSVADALLRAALERGAPDNVTVVIVEADIL